MPILNVEVVMHAGEALPSSWAQEIADAAGEVLQSAPQGTWVKVYHVEEQNYAENGGTAAGTAPVIVSVMKGKLQERDGLQTEVQELTARIAKICNRPPEHVHIIYEPEGMGRVAFGGKLIS